MTPVLLTCDECDGKVSERAVACPHCGAPVDLSWPTWQPDDDDDEYDDDPLLLAPKRNWFLCPEEAQPDWRELPHNWKMKKGRWRCRRCGQHSGSRLTELLFCPRDGEPHHWYTYGGPNGRDAGWACWKCKLKLSADEPWLPAADD